MLARSTALRLEVESALAHRFPAALTVRERPTAEVFSTGIARLDALTGMGGLPRGSLTEFCGPASSGRTSAMLSLLAQATSSKHPYQEACALIDASDAFHAESAQSAGVDLTRLLWVRGSSLSPVAKRTQTAQRTRKSSFSVLEQALKSTDLLLQSGGFGLVVIDLADMPPEIARRVPMTSWFRFRRAVENTSTALVVMEQEPFARTCASLVLRFQNREARWTSLLDLDPDIYSLHEAPPCCAVPTHTQLLCGLQVEVEVEAMRTQPSSVRKPVRPEHSGFSTQTIWNRFVTS